MKSPCDGQYEGKSQTAFNNPHNKLLIRLERLVLSGKSIDLAVTQLIRQGLGLIFSSKHLTLG